MGSRITRLASVGTLAFVASPASAQYACRDVAPWPLRAGGPYSTTEDSNKQITIDPDSGHVFVVGESKVGDLTAMTTWSYDSFGNLRWKDAWIPVYGETESKGSYAVAVEFKIVAGADGGRFLAVTGVTQTPGVGLDYVTILYDADGLGSGTLPKYIWPLQSPPTNRARIYNNDEQKGDDVAVDVGIDGFGMVYTTGYSEGAGTGNDILTIQYTLNQTWGPGWTRRRDGSQHLDDRPLDMEVGHYPFGETGTPPIDVLGIFVVGTTYETAAYGSAMVTLGYDFSGVLQPNWPRLFDSPGTDVGTAIDTFDPTPTQPGFEVNVCGTRGQITGANTMDFVTTAYYANGDDLWIPPNLPQHIYHGGFGDDFARDIKHVTTTQGRRLIVTGEAWRGTTNKYDFATIALDTGSGSLFWESHLNLANKDDGAFGLAAGGANDLYVVGVGFNGLNNDYLAIRYDALTGLPFWHPSQPYVTYSAGGVDVAKGVVVHPAQASVPFYLFGRSQTDTGSGGEFATVKFVQQAVSCP